MGHADIEEQIGSGPQGTQLQVDGPNRYDLALALAAARPCRLKDDMRAQTTVFPQLQRRIESGAGLY